MKKVEITKGMKLKSRKTGNILTIESINPGRDRAYLTSIDGSEGTHFISKIEKAIESGYYEIAEAPQAEKELNKKAFQKYVKKVRVERDIKEGGIFEYPKAMMTRRQQFNRTATINCAGCKHIAKTIMADDEFKKLLLTCDGSATIEKGSEGITQIRIKY